MELRAHTAYAALSWLTICLALLILVPAASTQSNFAFLQLPSPVQCQTYRFTWTSGGTPPYSITVSVNDNWGVSYGTKGLNGQEDSWTIPVPAGYAVSFKLFDNAGHVATAGPLTIQSSDDTSCLPSRAHTSSTPKSTITTSPVPTASSSKKTSTPLSSAPLTDTTTSSSSTSEAPSSQPPSSSHSSLTVSSSSSSSRSSTTSSSSIPPSTPSTSSTLQALPPTDGVLSTILATASQAAATNSSNPSPTPHHAALSTGTIAGVATGGAAVLVLAGLGIWFCRMRDLRSGSGAEWNTVYPDTPADDLRFGNPQISEAPRHQPRLLPATPSSSGSSSDPSASDWYGSHQLLLHPGSEGSVSGPSHLQLDNAARSRSAASFLPSSQFPRDGAQRDRLAVHDQMATPPDIDGPAMTTPLAFTPDNKLDSLTHPSRGTVQDYTITLVDGRPLLTDSARAPSMRFEEDGGVRLAGGLPGEVLDEGQDADYSRGWVIQPPPYQQFR